jgi:hypothetical protein
MATLPNRLFELVVLATEVPADDLAYIQKCADARNIRTVMLTPSRDASDNVHSVMLMPGSAKEFADLLSAALTNE